MASGLHRWAAARCSAVTLSRQLLQRASVSRESLVDLGLQVARRRHDDGRYYFIVNSGDRDVQGWIPLDDRAPAAVVFDPMTGRHGDARIRRSSAGALEVQVAIPSHGSLIVATTSKPVGRRFPAFEPAGPAIEIRGPWQVRFTPAAPIARAMRNSSGFSRGRCSMATK